MSTPVIDCHAKEQRENDDLQDLVLRHRIDHRRRHEVRDEILQREACLFNTAGGIDSGQGQMQSDAWLQRVDQDQPERQRDKAGANEPG